MFRQKACHQKLPYFSHFSFSICLSSQNAAIWPKLRGGGGTESKQEIEAGNRSRNGKLGLAASLRTEMLMPQLLTSTLTFLFTDIEGSTRLWEQNPDAMRTDLARHNQILRDAITQNSGHVFKTLGDAFCAAFTAASDALKAALAAQQILTAEAWASDLPLRVRMALHTGTADEWDADYFGPPLNRTARLMDAGHGGQILLSLVTEELTRDTLPPLTTLRDLEERRLRDLARPEQVFQLLHPFLPGSRRFGHWIILTCPTTCRSSPQALSGVKRSLGRSRPCWTGRAC